LTAFATAEEGNLGPEDVLVDRRFLLSMSVSLGTKHVDTGRCGLRFRDLMESRLERGWDVFVLFDLVGFEYRQTSTDHREREGRGATRSSTV
jgi:hypothetical protein